MTSIRKTILQMIKYSAVGVINTIIGLSVIFICMEILHWHYTVSNVAGYACGLASSFILNKRWTFISKGHKGRELAKFLFVFFIAYGIQFISLILFKEKLGVLPEIAQLMSIAVYTAVGFLLNKFFTFRQ